jgi:zinc-binding alcohol dehydrogenase/oxidoreductase
MLGGAMNAIVLRTPGGPEQLKYETFPTPEPVGGRVLVALKAAGINRRDLLVRKRNDSSQWMPFIPGSDGAGEVIGVGDEVEKFQRGDRVVVYPALNWGILESHPSENFEILGGPTNGTHAQFVCLPVENVFPLPSGISFQEAAALPVAGLTAWRALITKAKLLPGERVFIPGIGSGAGIFALQIARAVGGRVFVTSHSDQKIERALALGAEGGVNYTNPNWSTEIRDMAGGGVEVVIDSVGQETFRSGVELLNPGGRLVAFGTTTGSSTQFEIRWLYHKQISLMGTTMGSPREFQELLRAVSTNLFQPVIDCSYPLEEIASAHRRLENHEQFGKIILEIPE